MHGGKSLVAWVSPTYKHGEYSKYIVRRFRPVPAADFDEPEELAHSDTLLDAHTPNTPCTPNTPMAAGEIAVTGDAKDVTIDGDDSATAPARRRRQRPPAQGPTPEQVGLAAALCYLDVKSDEQIARQLGITRRTLARWKRRPDFTAATIALVAVHEREPRRVSIHPKKP